MTARADGNRDGNRCQVHCVHKVRRVHWLLTVGKAGNRYRMMRILSSERESNGAYNRTVSDRSVDVRLMEAALAEARLAAEGGEVPVGAVIAGADGEVIASGRNRMEALGDPTAHAEMLAIRGAAEKTGDWRLGGCVLYVTLEPCLMCLGAVMNSRIETVVFGAYDDRAGAFEGGCAPSAGHRGGGHRGGGHRNGGYRGGVLERECGGLIRDFFRKRRQKCHLTLS